MCRCGRAPTVVGSMLARRGAARDVSSAGPARPGAHDVVMRYVGDAALLLKGPISRRVYALDPGTTAVNIDARDVTVFSTSPLFEPVTKSSHA